MYTMFAVYIILYQLLQRKAMPLIALGKKIINNFCEGPLFLTPGNEIHQIWDLQLMMDGWCLSLVCEEVHGPIA